jgi:NADH dehydrogenase
VDLDRQIVVYEGFDGNAREMPFDHVVFSCGSVVNLAVVPGMADHAFPLKTIGDAVALRAHVMERLERAEVCDNEDHRRWLLSFIVVGGGYSGVEVAGEINDLARSSQRFFANIRGPDIQVTLVHSRAQILPEIGSSLREFARRKMEEAGIRMALEARVAAATSEGVTLKDGTVLRGGTVVCTVGNHPAPVLERLDAVKERGRLVTEPDMRLKGQENAWAIGDCAIIINAQDGKVSPPTGQFAERQGRQVAENIGRALAGQPTQPFSFKVLGQLCSIGHRNAVAEMFGLRLSGFPAWFLWRTVYLLKIPTWSRRIKVGFDWAWELVFSRDLAHLKANQTERISRAYHQGGDLIFRQGDPATNFYAIESGEVEVLRETESGEEQLLAVLGPGDFFGEMALIRNEPRNATVRARTPTEVVIMGKHVFTQISSSLSMVRDLLAKAVQRRTKSHWQLLPGAQKLLAHTSVEQLMQPVGDCRLDPDATFEDALKYFSIEGREFCCVLEGADLQGFLTQSALFRALENGARQSTPIAEFLPDRVIYICRTDSALAAAETMRDHDIKWLPVTATQDSSELVGMVRARDLMARVVREIADDPSSDPPSEAAPASREPSTGESSPAAP